MAKGSSLNRKESLKEGTLEHQEEHGKQKYGILYNGNMKNIYTMRKGPIHQEDIAILIVYTLNKKLQTMWRDTNRIERRNKLTVTAGDF